MKNIIAIFICVLSISWVNLKAQEQAHYFYPVVGGLINSVDGKNFFLIELPGKDSVTIYNALKKRIIKNFDDSKNVFVADDPNKYIRIFGRQQKSIGSGEYSTFDFTYNVDIDIKNGKYKFYFTNIKIDRLAKNGQIVSLVMKNGDNLFADTEKYLFHNNKPSKAFSSQYLDLVKWIDVISKIVDVRDSIDNKGEDW